MKTKKVFIGVILAAVAALIVALLLGSGWLLTQNGYGCGPGTMGRYGFPFGMHTFSGGPLMLLLWGVVIGGVVLLIASLARRDETPASRGESPLDILKRRYASGEIDRDEFERVKESLLS
jgi:putative membrane protein